MVTKKTQQVIRPSVISYYSSRGGVSIVREEGAVENESRSTLVLKEPGSDDEGSYTCRPLQGEFRSATTRLFMGTEAGAQGKLNLTTCVTIFVSFIHVCCYVCLVFFYV